MKTKTFYKASDFETWLKDKGDKQASQSRGYINSLKDNVLTFYGLDSIITNMETAIKAKDNTLSKLNDLYSKVNKAATLKKNNPNSHVLDGISRKPSSILQWCSVFKSYIEFLGNEEPGSDDSKAWGAKQWNTNLKKFWSKTITAVSIDGYQSLLNAPSMNGNEENFVKLAIESSFFFNGALTTKRHKELINDLKKQTPIYARKSTDNNIQQQMSSGYYFIESPHSKIKIKIDNDGNKAVRDLIEAETGFTVSSGYDNFFTNFKISHLWGNAFDPRFFTSLWNIVLVPAWANDILDKSGSNQSLAKKMINTYMAISEKLYTLPTKWNNLNISHKATLSQVSNVVQGDYSIQLIGGKKQNLIGTITKCDISV